MVSLKRRKPNKTIYIDTICDKIEEITGVTKVNRDHFEDFIDAKVREMVFEIERDGGIKFEAEKAYVREQIYESVAREIISYGQVVERRNSSSTKFDLDKKGARALEASFKGRALDSALSRFKVLKESYKQEKKSGEVLTKGSEVRVEDARNFLITVMRMVNPKQAEITDQPLLVEVAQRRLQALNNESLRPSEKIYLTKNMSTEFMYEILGQVNRNEGKIPKTLSAKNLNNSKSIEAYKKMKKCVNKEIKNSAAAKLQAKKKAKAASSRKHAPPRPPSPTHTSREAYRLNLRNAGQGKNLESQA